jgi:hypothetical protein
MVTWHIVDDDVECLHVERNPTVTCSGSHLYKFYRFGFIMNLITSFTNILLLMVIFVDKGSVEITYKMFVLCVMKCICTPHICATVIMKEYLIYSILKYKCNLRFELV